MRSKPVIPRLAAEDDLDQACQHYDETAGTEITEAFLIDFERATSIISQCPEIGSLRYSFGSDGENLRSWPLKNFPYIICYIEPEQSIDVWRVLHGNMDISTRLSTIE